MTSRKVGPKTDQEAPDMGGVKQEIREVREGIGEVRQEIGEVRQCLRSMEQGVTERLDAFDAELEAQLAAQLESIAKLLAANRKPSRQKPLQASPDGPSG